MSFREKFLPFVCEGDTITCAVDGFEVTARIVCDDCPDAPDQRQDGFWPSLDLDAPGFIGPGPSHRQRFAEAEAESKAVMEGWRKGDWFYCGLVLCVSLEGIELAPHATSLWGIEANYPGTDNSYLTEAANELLPDAMTVARETLARLIVHAQAAEAEG
jgi:hypothetical protein